MPDFKKSAGYSMKNKGNFDFGNRGNFMNLEETGSGPADNIDFHKGEGSIGAAVTPENKKPLKKKSAVKNYKTGYYGA